jgi:predicted RNase H-like nuclease (RuvC/YqgF family)
VADHTDGKPPAEVLEECEEKVKHLKEENAVLRHSSQTFGDLAERLNTKRKSVEESRRQPRKRRGMGDAAARTTDGP